MVFNDKVLFIHLGKTGGMSITAYMQQTLRAPVIEVENANLMVSGQNLKKIVVPGIRHANLVQAAEFVSHHGLKLPDFEVIFAVVRDPLSMEQSYYKHLRKETVIRRVEKIRGTANDRLEMAQLDFDSFAKSNITHFTGDLAAFFTIEGKIPPNMQILKFEEISVAVPKLLAPYQTHSRPFPHKNKSSEKVDLSQLSQEAILNIRKKYSWFYDQGFYSFPPNLSAYNQE